MHAITIHSGLQSLSTRKTAFAMSNISKYRMFDNVEQCTKSSGGRKKLKEPSRKCIALPVFATTVRMYVRDAAFNISMDLCP